MKKQFNKGTADGGLVIGFLIIAVIVLFCTANFHVSNSGQHTGYVSSVEQSGIFWKTWTAYIKTDPQSSQEDSYCVIDPDTVTALQSAATERSLITVYYSVPLLTWKWQCGYEQSTIQSVNSSSSSGGDYQAYLKAIGTEPSSSTVSNATTTSNDPASYEGTVIQTGGIGSQIVSTTAVDLTPEALTSAGQCNGYVNHAGVCLYYLNPAGDYVLPFAFHSPGDGFAGTDQEPSWVGSSYLMLVACKNGYEMINASSPTNNPLDTYFMGLSNMGIGMEILDQSSNTVQITCQKR